MKLSSEVETLQPNISDFPKKPKKTFPWTKMASDGSELGTLEKLDPWEPLKLSIAKKILSNWITENMSPWAKSNPYSKLARSLVRNMPLKMLPIYSVITGYFWVFTWWFFKRKNDDLWPKLMCVCFSFLQKIMVFQNWAEIDGFSNFGKNEDFIKLAQFDDF